MKLSDLDYFLPEELIAQEPLIERQASRMMVLNRQTGEIEDRKFVDLPGLLGPGDVLVLNNTKVFPARLHGKTETGANVEIFLIKQSEDFTWKALSRPARRLSSGKKIMFSDELTAEVVERGDGGLVSVRFVASAPLEDILDRIGKTPLPPYIKRQADSPDRDSGRYQTVFAKHRGSIAAPTAGLHFTDETLAAINRRGVQIVEITLHVGYGTFEPVRVDEISEHRVSVEHYQIDSTAAEILNRTLKEKRRIIAVGTTTTRTLESSMTNQGAFMPGEGIADLTITPPYRFKAVNGLVTNFHLPKSSLLILVSTLAGRQLIMKAYEHAVAERYRFYSYGDCMFIV